MITVSEAKEMKSTFEYLITKGDHEEAAYVCQIFKLTLSLLDSYIKGELVVKDGTGEEE